VKRRLEGSVHRFQVLLEQSRERRLQGPGCPRPRPPQIHGQFHRDSRPLGDGREPHDIPGGAAAQLGRDLPAVRRVRPQRPAVFSTIVRSRSGGMIRPASSSRRSVHQANASSRDARTIPDAWNRSEDMVNAEGERPASPLHVSPYGHSDQQSYPPLGIPGPWSAGSPSLSSHTCCSG